MGFAPDGTRRFKPSSSGSEEARLWHWLGPDGGIGILVGNNIFPFCGRAAVHTVLRLSRTPKAPPRDDATRTTKRKIAAPRILALTRKQIEL